MALFKRSVPPPPPEDGEVVEPEVVDPGPQLPPGRLRGSETLYGYVVGIELLVVAVISVFARRGVGAPVHYSTGDNVELAVGAIAAVAYLGLLRLGNRTVAAFGAIIAAYVLSITRGPNWVRDMHEFALLPPLVYAVVVAQRLRKATKLSLAEGRGAGRGGSRPGRERPARERVARERPAGRGRGRQATGTPAGPQGNARYTPPKPKRAPAKKAAEPPSRNQRRAQKSE